MHHCHELTQPASLGEDGVAQCRPGLASLPTLSRRALHWAALSLRLFLPTRLPEDSCKRQEPLPAVRPTV